MFAFAIWDAKKRRLFLARDRLGKKPLYYWQGNDKFVFGSEIKAILQHTEVPRQVDLEALQFYLAFGYVPAPWTMFAGIKKLPPGHSLLCDPEGVRVERYWDITFIEGARRVAVGDAIDEIRWRVQEAVRLRLIADVPLGAFLSGGVDFVTIVALMAQASSTPVKTFTVGFDIDGWYNEFKEARLVAQRYHTEHYETVLSAPDVPELLAKVLWHLDEPIADPAALPTYLICEFAWHHVTVVLTGEGGDELFGGYPRYGWFQRAKRFESFLPSLARSALLGITTSLPMSQMARHSARLLLSDLSDAERHLLWVGMFHRKEHTFARQFANSSTQHLTTLECLVSAYLDGGPRDALVHRLMYLDMKTWLVDDILMKVDKMSMAVSLEARAPFLDHKLMEFVVTLPEDLKIYGRQTKWLLKKAFADLLPERITRRRKHAFRVPTGDWFRGKLRAYISEQLLAPHSAVGRYLGREQVQSLVQEHLHGGANHEQSLWTLLCFELWHRMFIDGEQVA